MTSFQTSAELLDRALFAAGEPTDGTSDFEAEALRHLNAAYRGLWSGGGTLVPDVKTIWWWLKASAIGTLTLNPVYTTGSVSVTNNSTSVTASAVISASKANWYFKVDNHADVFRVSTHTAGTDAITLDSVYTGTTDATATYKLFQLDYTLASDLLYLASPMRCYQDGRYQINMVDEENLDETYPLVEADSGVPKVFAMLDTQEVKFSHYGGTSSTDLIRVDYSYVPQPTDLADDSNEPLLPLHHRMILADWAAARILLDKNDDRARVYMEAAAGGIRNMYKEHLKIESKVGNRAGQIYPRQDQLSFMRDRPLRTSSGLIIG